MTVNGRLNRGLQLLAEDVKFDTRYCAARAAARAGYGAGAPGVGVEFCAKRGTELSRCLDSAYGEKTSSVPPCQGEWGRAEGRAGLVTGAMGTSGGEVSRQMAIGPVCQSG
jgi:hypothetical protein